MPERIQHTFPAKADALGSLRRELRAFAQRCGAPDEAAVALAVSEAATNVVLHAFAGRAPGEITVDACCDDERLSVVISDDGRGMRPRPDSPGFGLGLPLMTQLADAFDIAARPGGGTKVSLRFALSP